MRVISFEYDGKKFDFNEDALDEKLREYRHRCELIGSVVVPLRNKSDKLAEKVQHQKFASELEYTIEEFVTDLMVQAFHTGFEYAKMSDGKQFHCKVCLTGYDTVKELFAHVEASSNPDCQKALEKALYDTVK